MTILPLTLRPNMGRGKSTIIVTGQEEGHTLRVEGRSPILGGASYDNAIYIIYMEVGM